MIKPAEFMHPEDAAALRQLESIPGFPAVAKKVLELGYEKLMYGLNMASTIRLSPTQLPELYKHLPPICEKLGIKEPEFYLEMNPMPNEWHSFTDLIAEQKKLFSKSYLSSDEKMFYM